MQIYTKVPQPSFEKNAFEYSAWKGNRAVCGIDEVGRGCLAGPVVTAAVMLPIGQAPGFLKDSKIMTLKEREKAAIWIKNNCRYSIGIAHNRLVDQHNIYQATLIAMKKAALHIITVCPQKPHALLIDAMPLSLHDTAYQDIPIHHFIQGESKSSSIAAASILAKVYRDNLMHAYADIFPSYFLQEHKGYCTKKHQEAIKKELPSIIHRLSFLTKIVTLKDEKHGDQKSLC